MSVPDIDVSSLRERLRKVDTSADAVAKRVKLLREDYAADGAGVDADLIEALAAELVVEKADNQFTRDARIAHLTKRYGECVAEKEKYRAALDRAEKERDAQATRHAATEKDACNLAGQCNALKAELAKTKNELDVAEKVNQLWLADNAALKKEESEDKAQLAAVKAEREELVEALKVARKEIAHEVPYSCYATGPLTGDPFQDLVVCPGCAALKKIDVALAKAAALRGHLPSEAGEGK